MKKKILFSLPFLFLHAVAVLASPITVDLISAPDGLTIQNKAAVLSLPTTQMTESLLSQSNVATVQNKTFDKTSNIVKQARGVYDFAQSGGATNQNISLGLGLPVNAIIKNMWFDVVTHPNSGQTTTTIGISSQTGADLFADTALATFYTGPHQGKTDGTTANAIKLTAATDAFVNVKSGSLTAGKFVVFVDYMVSE